MKVKELKQFHGMEIVAKSYEENNEEKMDFVAMAENEEYGWFGSIFHPEKV